jgi:hypothetical protein
MFHLIPDEVNEHILLNINYDPVSLYNLKNINTYFKKKILMIKDYQYNNLLNNYDSLLNTLCCKKTSLETFMWLFRNNVTFNLVQINNLIRNNHINVIKNGIIHDNFIDILFDKQHSSELLYWQNKEKYPLFIAGKYNRLEIIKILFQTKFNNFHLNNINLLFNVCVNLNHKNIIKYLVIEFFDLLIKNISFYSCLFKLNDAEDIIFYLLLSKKLIINHELFKRLIINNYYESFIFCYKQLKDINIKVLLCLCLEYNSKKILLFLLNQKNMNNEIRLYKSDKINKGLLLFLINNYLYIFDKKSDLIYLCMERNIPKLYIKMLINKNFNYSFDELHLALGNKDIPLLTLLCNNL